MKVVTYAIDNFVKLLENSAHLRKTGNVAYIHGEWLGAGNHTTRNKHSTPEKLPQPHQIRRFFMYTQAPPLCVQMFLYNTWPCTNGNDGTHHTCSWSIFNVKTNYPHKFYAKCWDFQLPKLGIYKSGIFLLKPKVHHLGKFAPRESKLYGIQCVFY